MPLGWVVVLSYVSLVAGWILGAAWAGMRERQGEEQVEEQVKVEVKVEKNSEAHKGRAA